MIAILIISFLITLCNASDSINNQQDQPQQQQHHQQQNNSTTAARKFSINYETNTFEMDGKEFQYVAGSFHYFRAVPDVWEDRLKMMRAAGLNALDTYVEWSLHNPQENVYDFDGIANVEGFLTLAQKEGFYVILRPGPYICAERDNGGVPYWLFTKYPNIQLRTSDPDYLKEVRIWYGKLMPKLQKFLYENGGPIILVQVENEYGVFKKCDKVYLNWLRDETQKYVQNKAVLFTVDIPNSVDEMKCGHIDGVFATTDFGIDRAHEMDAIWKMLRQIQTKGPLVNSEFYPGWLTHWQEKNQRRDARLVADTLKKMLELGANVNFYMFFGGTNFGFTAGANDWGTGKYMADITSYDYDAVMDEAGDPNNPKFQYVKEVIEQHFKLQPTPLPPKETKMSLSPISLTPVDTLLSRNGRRFLGRPHGNSSSNPSILFEPDESIEVSSEEEVATISYKNRKPLTFEAINQYSGLVLYETDLPQLEIDPTLLKINGLRDRALVYIDGILIGILSRENAIDTLPIGSEDGKRLQILVENQGRINFNIANDKKGILENVTVQQFNGTHRELKNWTITGYPLTNYAHFLELLDSADPSSEKIIAHNGKLLHGPVVFHVDFNIKSDTIYDTYLDPTGWGKGIAYINGFHLGRYWPKVGPQITLYVPKSILRKGINSILLLEYQRAAADRKIRFTNIPLLDGATTD